MIEKEREERERWWKRLEKSVALAKLISENTETALAAQSAKGDSSF